MSLTGDFVPAATCGRRRDHPNSKSQGILRTCSNGFPCWRALRRAEVGTTSPALVVSYFRVSKAINICGELAIKIVPWSMMMTARAEFPGYPSVLGDVPGRRIIRYRIAQRYVTTENFREPFLRNHIEPDGRFIQKILGWCNRGYQFHLHPAPCEFTDTNVELVSHCQATRSSPPPAGRRGSWMP